MADKPPDMLVRNEGSIVLLVPSSQTGEEWLNENIGLDNGFQPYWPSVVVEPRYIGDILAGMTADGLTIEE